MKSSIKCNEERAWFSLLPVLLFILYDFIQLNMLNSMSMQTMHLLGIYTFKFGFYSSLYFYINLILLFASGVILEWFSTKSVMLTSLFISWIGFLSFITEPAVSTLIIWRLTAGIAGAFSITSSIRFIYNYFSLERIGFLIGLLGFVSMLGGLLAQVPLSWCVLRLGYRDTLIYVALFGFFVILCMVALMHDNAPVINDHRNLLNQIFSAFSNLRNWIAALFECIVNLPLFVLGALWGSAYLIHVCGLRNTQASVVISMLFVGHMIGAPLFGFLTDRFRSRKVLMFVGIFISSVALLRINASFGCTYFVLLLSFLLLGIATGSQCVADVFVVHNSKEHVSVSIGLLYSVAIVGGAVFQPTFGWIVEHHSSIMLGYRHAMYLLIAVTLSAAILPVFVPNKSVT